MSFTHQKFHSRIVEFRHIWLSIEHFVGNAHLPLFAEAQELNEFIFDLDSQSNPLHSVLQETFHRAKCRTLSSSIDPFIIMDVLGECLFNQKNRDDVDVTLIDLIERIGLHISRQFIYQNDEKLTRPTPIDKSNTIITAKIISFKNFQKQ